jgi:hypothetical protein
MSRKRATDDYPFKSCLLCQSSRLLGSRGTKQGGNEESLNSDLRISCHDPILPKSGNRKYQNPRSNGN